jgi:N-acetyl-anhydromuramyl-L-alanine amidase AmpD
MAATKDQVAQLIVGEAKARNHTRDECLAELSALYQESGLDDTIWDPTHTTYGVAQKDGSYRNRFDGAAAQVKAFFDKLDAKRTSPGHGDIWLNICWLQQAPNWPSAQYWWDHGRQAYLTEIKSRISTVTPYLDKYWPTGAPAPAPVSYGLPAGSNSGGYGGGGVKFPDWVYALGNAFGLKPSTYPGHQESDRNEAGYAPNPQHLNRGIDWAAPGAPDEVDRMQQFADYLFSIRGELEQVIWWNPDGRKIGVAGGKDVTNTPYYNYAGGYDDHRDHVHTRQSHPIPIPGGAPVPSVPKPQFTEREMFGNGSSVRTRPPINFLLHTQEADASAESLAVYCNGSNDVSYHYTLRDGILYDVVDTDLASWSVLSANAFTINLCFAGSFAAWSRDQWMTRESDIEIAAYIAVQDCHKYGIPTDVIAPPYHQAAGISDHKYVTQQLHIGDHVDVGNNFPWDVFASYVTKYATTAPTQGDDDLSVEAERMIAEMYTEYKKEKRGPTRSFFAPDQNPVDSPLGFLWNADGNIWNITVTLAYLFGVTRAEELVNSVAQNGVVPTSWAGQLTDAQGHWLAEWGQQWCLGLIAFRAAIQKSLKASGATVVGVADSGLSTAQAQDIASRAANAAAGAAAAQVQAAVNNLPVPAAVEPTPVSVELAAHPADEASNIADLYRSLKAMGLADALPIESRAPLAALLSILQTKNGTTV